MSSRVTFRLLLLVAFLGGVFWLAEKRFLSDRPERSAELRLIPFLADDVVSVVLRRGPSTVSCSRRGDGWWMEPPLSARADPAVIAKLLGVVESLPSTETVTERQRKARDLTLANYGLEPPSNIVTFATSSGSWSLHIGMPSVVGDSVYVRLAGSPDVHATSIALLEALPGGPDAMRDRRIFRGEPFRTVRCEVAGPAFVKLAKTGGGRWAIEQPVKFRADSPAVERLLQAVYALKADRFVWDQAQATNASVSSARVETYGLSDDEATMRIGVWIAGDDAGQELVVGKSLPDDPAKVFARLRGGASVCAVSRQAVEACRTSVQELADRDVFPCSAGDVRAIELRGQDKVVRLAGNGKSWSVTEPVQWQADTQTVYRLLHNLVNLKITGFADSATADLKALGFAPFLCTVALSNNVPQAAADSRSPEARRGAPAVETLQVSSAPPQEGQVLARFESGGTVFRIPAEILAWLGPDPLDPLAYRDRQILAIPPETVNRISLVRGGAEQTVVRVASGAWEAVSPPGRTVDGGAVAGVLKALGSLRALRIEYRGPGNPEAYGFDGTAVSLAVGISSGEGIRKTLAIGYRAGTDGRFVMLQGQDVVFVLERGVAETLTSDLVQTPRSEGQPSQ
jgi:hypothetical protein